MQEERERIVSIAYKPMLTANEVTRRVAVNGLQIADGREYLAQI